MKKKLFILLLAAALAAVWFGTANASLGDYSLDASASINVTYTRTWQWDIDKCVTPAEWDLFAGDEAVSRYTVAVTKKGSTDAAALTGQVSVANVRGLSPTEGLAITVSLSVNDGTGFVPLGSKAVSVSAMPSLAQGASRSYPFSFDITPMPGATYAVTAHVTTMNDMFQKLDDVGNPYGPTVSATAETPSAPAEKFATVHVTDTWAGAGSPWTFSNSGSVSYDRVFAPGEAGVFDNTATITETGQSDSARVTVRRYNLCLSKTAEATYKKKYVWTIDKTGDKTDIKLALNQSMPVNYTVKVTASPVESDFGAKGVITVKNTAPIDAEINSVSDIVSGGIAASVNTSVVTFPYTLKAGATLTLPYTVALPDKSARTNTATAVQQNHRYTAAGRTPKGTTSVAGTAGIAFGQPTSVIDGSAVVSDNLYGTLGTVQASATPVTFKYALTLKLICKSDGSYTVTTSKGVFSSGIKCTTTTWTVTNTATLKTCDTCTVLKDSWTVKVTKGTVVYTRTIGYWKNHLCDVGKLLPIWLGSQGGCKSVYIANTTDAYKYLSMSVGSSSNGIVKLYAQLLAAKLNIKSGADPSAVSSVVSKADQFLATRGVSSWTSLSSSDKNLVLSWATTLDNYNNGVIGPGHAD